MCHPTTLTNSRGWGGGIGVFLADLTFIEEVPSHLKTGQVNFEKMHLVSKVISEVERYQKTPYKFYPVVPIEEYLENVTTLPGAFHTTQ